MSTLVTKNQPLPNGQGLKRPQNRTQAHQLRGNGHAGSTRQMPVQNSANTINTSISSSSAASQQVAPRRCPCRRLGSSAFTSRPVFSLAVASRRPPPSTPTPNPIRQPHVLLTALGQERRAQRLEAPVAIRCKAVARARRWVRARACYTLKPPVQGRPAWALGPRRKYCVCRCLA